MSKIKLTNQSAPTTPSSGKTEVYVDSVTKKIASKDDAGVVTAYTSATGVSATTAKARAHRYSAYTPGAANAVKVPLNVEDYDPGNNFDDVTNYRFVAPVSGYYAVSGRVGITPWNEEIYYALLYVNGVEKARGSVIRCTASEINIGLVVSDIVYMASGSYVELWAYCTYQRPFVTGSSQTYMAVHLLST